MSLFAGEISGRCLAEPASRGAGPLTSAEWVARCKINAVADKS